MAIIRVSDELYRKLNRVAGQLRDELGHPVSMEEVLEHLLRSGGLKPSEFAGSWKISDEELGEILKGLKGFWSHWKYQLSDRELEKIGAKLFSGVKVARLVGEGRER